MKKMILMVIVCVFVGISNAALVTNGDFPSSAEFWDATGGPAPAPTGWNVTHDAGGWLTLDVDSGSWAVWYQTITESLAEWGIPVGTDIVVSADIISIDGGALGSAALKIEAIDGSVANGEYEEIVVAVTTSWVTYEMGTPYTILAGTDQLKCIIVHKGFSTGELGFDNVEITVDPNNPALKPIPIMGDTIDPIDDVLSWVNPDPNVGSVTADVYILESATPLVSPDPRTGTKVATAITAETLDLSDAPVPFTLSADKFYYWAVDTDYEAKVVPGFTWNFVTQTIDAGADQYRWLTPSTDTFTLTGVASGTPDSVLWEDISNVLEQAPDTIVTINSPTASMTTVDVDGDGWYLFKFSATYGDITISDEVNVGVYVDACEAAKADPGDIPATYPGGHGDIDGDCDTDLVDFALMAASWMDCMTSKIVCP